MKPKVFIGSSMESLPVAYAVQESLEYEAEVTVWSQDAVELSKSALDSLIEKLERSDFGIFILGDEDVIRLRGEEHKAPRDNVILELGLFIGGLGKARTFVIQPRLSEDLHLPTDLLGLTPALFDPEREDGNLSASLGPACTKILAAIRKATSLPKDKEIELQGKLERVLYITLAELADTTGVRSEDIGIHLWTLAQSDVPSGAVLSRKARVRVSGVAPSPIRSWAKGEGVVGQCWESQSEVWVDFTDPRYMSISEAAWNGLREKDKFGMNYEGYIVASGIFLAIFAAPIVVEEKFIGCISVNIERTSKIPFNAIWTDEVKRLLRRTAEFIGILLR